MVGNKLQEYLGFNVIRDGQRIWPLPLFHDPDTPEAQRTRDKVFPISIAEGLDRLKASTVVGAERQKYEHDVLTGDGVDWLGYQFCESRVGDELVDALSKSAHVGWRVLQQCRLGDFTVQVDGSSCSIGRWTAFENDEYAIIPTNIFQD